MEDMKSLDINFPLNFNLDQTEIEEFKDGVLLCEIVSKLEMTPVENVTYKPKSQASALHNIRKALNILKKRKSIPLYLIYAE